MDHSEDNTENRVAGPLPKFDGITLPGQGAQPQIPPPPGGPIRVPPLSPDKVNEYSSLFEKTGAQNGLLSGTHLASEPNRS